MYCLTDTNVSNGCLRILKGTHRKRHMLHDELSEAHNENLINYKDKNSGSCRQIGEAGVVLVYYDPFELTTFQQEYGDDPVSHQGFAE